MHESLNYATRGNHVHTPHHTYEGESIAIDSTREVRQLAGICETCAQLLHAVGVYSNGVRTDTGRWMTNQESVQGAWTARRKATQK